MRSTSNSRLMRVLPVSPLVFSPRRGHQCCEKPRFTNASEGKNRMSREAAIEQHASVEDAELVHDKRIVVVMPAYNAAQTLELTYRDIPLEWVTRVILVDDASRDETLEVAGELPLEIIKHHRNVGYGGNQKTCYTAALREGADVVVMLHPDGQYDPR